MLLSLCLFTAVYYFSSPLKKVPQRERKEVQVFVTAEGDHVVRQAAQDLSEQPGGEDQLPGFRIGEEGLTVVSVDGFRLALRKEALGCRRSWSGVCAEAG